MITPGGTPGQETRSQPIRDASGTTWNGLGQCLPPPPRPGMRKREREQFRLKTNSTSHFTFRLCLRGDTGRGCTVAVTVESKDVYHVSR